MKKRKLAAAFLSACLLGGCMKSVRLNERGIVRALGIDLPASGGCRLTMQINLPSGEDAVDKPLVIEEEGRTITDALARAAVSQGKQLFLGDCRLIVLGQALAQMDASPALDFLNTNSMITPSATVLLAEGTANEILGIQEKAPRLDAEGLIEMTEGAYHYGRAPRSRLLDLINAAESDHLAGTLAVVSVEGKDSGTSPSPDSQPDEGEASENPEESDAGSPDTPESEGASREKPAQAEVSGVAVFDRGHLGFLMEEEAARGFGWMQKGIRGAPLVVGDERLGKVSTLTVSHRAKIVPEAVGDLLVFHMEVEIRSAVQETALSPGLTFGEEERAYAARLQERLVESQIQEAVDASRRWGYDLFGLSLLVRQKDPDFYQKHQEDWMSIVQKSGYDIQVSCEIERTGGTKQEEV